MALKPYSGPVQPKKEAAAKGRSILYVEDEETNWDIAEKRLRDKYDLTHARNSDEAFNKLATQKFDAILMDIQLANSAHDGISICRILRGHLSALVPPKVAHLVGHAPPIIFVTAYSARYDKDTLMRYGGDDMIAKPVDFVQLSTSLTRLILRGIR